MKLFGYGYVAGALMVFAIYQACAAIRDRKVRRIESDPEQGSVFLGLFAGVAMLGILGAGINMTMRGPVTTMANVTKRTVAENNMIASSKLAVVMPTTVQANNGDCDSDGYVEPLPYRDAGANPKPAGGGYIPTAVGASLTDPWATQYGYCVWDAGPKTVSDNVAACGGTAALRLKGAPNNTQMVVTIISAGPDRTFQTACNAYADANNDNLPDTALVVKPAGSDDLVMGYTYAEANNISGNGLWNLKTGTPTTAQIAKDIEVQGGAAFSGSLRLGGGLILPGDPGNNSITGPCNAANDQQLRRNTSTTAQTLEICNFTGGMNAWTAISAAGANGSNGSGGGSGGGTPATAGPSFRVDNGTIKQSIPSLTWTKMTLGSIAFDTGNGWSTTNNRYTPTVAGKYIVTGNVFCNTSGNGWCLSAIYKNGVVYSFGSSTNVNRAEGLSGVSSIVDMNGTTDYIELWGYDSASSPSVGYGSAHHYLSGAMIGPVGGTGGGGGTGAGVLAWGNFSTAAGTGNPPVTINAGSNIASVTNIATGQYQINFTNPLNTANYAVSGICQTDPGTSYYNDGNECVVSIAKGVTSPLTTSSVRIATKHISSSGGGIYFAPGTFSIQIIGNGAGNGGGDNLGNHTATQDLSMGSKKITNLATPVASTDAANKAYVDSVSGGGAVVGTPGNSFSVNNGSTQQNLPANTDTKMIFGTKVFDTNGDWSTTNSRFTPKIAGKYLFNGSISCRTAPTQCIAIIAKNGSRFVFGSAINGSTHTGSVSGIVDMNGTTDYVELWGYGGGGITGGYTDSQYFSGSLLAATIAASSGPSFSVNNGTSTQTVTAGTWTKMTLGTKVFDANGDWSTTDNRFTPKIAGKYLFEGNVFCSAPPSGGCASRLYKNGTYVMHGASIYGNYNSISPVSAIIDMNGTTDYVELWGVSGGTSMGFDQHTHNLSGTMIGGGTGAGSSGAAGSAGSVQYNVGGTFSGNNKFTYDGTNLSITGGVYSAAASDNGFSALDRNGNGKSSVFYRSGDVTRLWDSTGGDRLLIDATNGNVGIGTVPEGYRLAVDGSGSTSHGILAKTSGSGGALLAYHNNTGYYCWVGHPSYSIICNGPTAGVSDGRLKKDVHALKETEGLDAIMALHPIRYRWKNDRMNESHPEGEIGFIAQDVEKVLPDLVSDFGFADPLASSSRKPEEKRKSLSYERLIAPAILAIQQLKHQFDAFRKEIMALFDRHTDELSKLTARMDATEAENKKLRERLDEMEAMQEECIGCAM